MGLSRLKVVSALGLDYAGHGYIAGVAPGIVTVNGAPAARRVRVFERASGRLVAETFSASDGTYRVNGLSPDILFDVVGRDYAGVYNDTIVSRVRPEPMRVTSATGEFEANDDAMTLDGAIDILGGDDHEVQVVDGTAPPGITFAVVTDGPPVYEYVARWLIANGTTTAGSYTWTLRVTDALGAYVDIACSATFT